MLKNSITTTTILRTLATILLFGLALWVIMPYIKAFSWAALFAFAFLPIFKKFQYLFRNKNLASILFSFLIMLGVLLPLFLLFFTMIQEILVSLDWFKTHDLKELTPTLSIPYIGDKLNLAWQSYLQKPQNIFNELKKVETATWVNAASTSLGFILEQAETLFFMLIVLFFMFKDIIPFLKRLEKRINKNEVSQRQFFKKMYSQFLGIVQSFFYVGIAIGIFMTCFFSILGLPIPFVLGTIAAICSIIPFVSPIYYIILFLFLILQGKIITSFVLLVLGIGLTQIIDNWLQPYIMSKKSKIHFLNILFGILGGMQAFGLIGVVLGPLILSAVCEIIKIYSADQQQKRREKLMALGSEQPINTTIQTE